MERNLHCEMYRHFSEEILPYDRNRNTRTVLVKPELQLFTLPITEMLNAMKFFNCTSICVSELSKYKMGNQ